jgi:hypothetical protein
MCLMAVKSKHVSMWNEIIGFIADHLNFILKLFYLFADDVKQSRINLHVHKCYASRQKCFELVSRMSFKYFA